MVVSLLVEQLTWNTSCRHKCTLLQRGGPRWKYKYIALRGDEFFFLCVCIIIPHFTLLNIPPAVTEPLAQSGGRKPRDAGTPRSLDGHRNQLVILSNWLILQLNFPIGKPLCVRISLLQPCWVFFFTQQFCFFSSFFAVCLDYGIKSTLAALKGVWAWVKC